MDAIKEQHERAIADAFINWYNQQHNTIFRFHKRGETPDFVYIFGNQIMLLEVTGSYYNDDWTKPLRGSCYPARFAP